MCSAISKLHKFSDCAEHIYNRLKALANRMWSVTEIGKTQQLSSLIPRPSIAANTVEGLVKLLRRMTSGGRMSRRMVDVGCLEAWYFR